MTKTAYWRNLVEARGLQYQDDGHTTTGSQTLTAAVGGDRLCDLSYDCFVHVTGDDAEAFLHGQLTHDIWGLDGTRARLCGYCDPRGRLLAVLYVLRIDDGFLLQLPRSIADSVINRLRMFVLRAKVTIERRGTLASCGIIGAEAPARLAAVVSGLPEDPLGLLRFESLLVLRRPAPLPRYQLIAPVDSLTELVSPLTDDVPFVGSRHWAWLDIKAGIPSICPETSGLFVPQMVNLDLIDGVSFNKGCYPGQEIVARMRYLGKLKQRMFLCHAAAGSLPLPGAGLTAAGKESQIGRVVDAQQSPDSGVDMLAVLRIEQARSLPLALGDGRSVEMLELPYSITSRSQRHA